MDVETGAGWSQVARELSARDAATLDGDELDRLSDAWFWLDELPRSIAARAAAHRAHQLVDDPERAALSAWRLFYEHWLVGDVVIGLGWLAEAHAEPVADGGPAAGWLAVADADVALADGRDARAVERARHALAVAEACQDVDQLAMALQVLGRALASAGDVDDGLRHLDRAMVTVVAEETTPLFTGWIYCNAIATSTGLADLERASAWSAAATRWSARLREGLLYPGLCRVYAARLALLHGDWDAAGTTARRAIVDLEAHDERYAAGAHYLLGEVARLRGDVDAANAAYAHAHGLGHGAQPGLALLVAQRGDPAAAVGALRTALAASGQVPLARATLAVALVDAALAAGDHAAARAAAHELDAVVRATPHRPVLEAHRDVVTGRLALARRAADEALRPLHAARRRFHELRLRPDEARTRVWLAEACAAAGDELTARLEATAALADLEDLGAVADVAAVRRLLDPAATAGDGGPLTDREVEVLRLVARGLTNQEVAEHLVLSRHTVARHLANVYGKLGVGSRTAAVSWAHARGLVAPTPTGPVAPGP